MISFIKKNWNTIKIHWPTILLCLLCFILGVVTSRVTVTLVKLSILLIVISVVVSITIIVKKRRRKKNEDKNITHYSV